MTSYCAVRYFRSLLSRSFNAHKALRRCSSDVQADPLPEKKSIKVAIIGAPNSGKSTLINQIVKRKILPISKKVHTTRWKAKAVMIEEETQLIFLDTPGLVTSSETEKYKLKPQFLSDGEEAIGEADVIGVVHDMSNGFTNGKLDPKVLRLLHIFRSKESFLVLNKIDTVKSKRQLLDHSNKLTGGQLKNYSSTSSLPLSETAIAEIIREQFFWEHFSDVFMTSALLNNGVDDLKMYLLNAARPGEWPFPESTFTDQNPVQIIEETVRSKLLDALPQELPYNLDIQLEFLDFDKLGRIITVVLVQCKTLRIVRLIKGIKGKRIQEISEEAQQSLADAFLKQVSLTVVVELQKKENSFPDG